MDLKYDRMPTHPAHSLRMLLLVCTCPLHSGQTRQANGIRSNVCHNEEIAADVRHDERGGGVPLFSSRHSHRFGAHQCAELCH